MTIFVRKLAFSYYIYEYRIGLKSQRYFRSCSSSGFLFQSSTRTYAGTGTCLHALVVANSCRPFTFFSLRRFSLCDLGATSFEKVAFSNTTNRTFPSQFMQDSLRNALYGLEFVSNCASLSHCRVFVVLVVVKINDHRFGLEHVAARTCTEQDMH